jgi:hypothetical protein
VDWVHILLPHAEFVGNFMFHTGCFTTYGIITGCDLVCLCDQICSFKHLSDFGRLQSYHRFKLRIEGNDY